MDSFLYKLTCTVSQEGYVIDHIKIPKWVEERLLKDEKPISKISRGSRFSIVDYYATNKRILRFSSKSDCEALEYDKVSITFKKHGLATSVFRIFSIIFGLIVISLGIFSYIGPEFHAGTTLIRTKAPFLISLAFLAIGLIVILAAIGGRYGYYQIRGQGFDEKKLKRWRIEQTRWGGGKVKSFAKIVEEKAGKT